MIAISVGTLLIIYAALFLAGMLSTVVFLASVVGH
jgi:hypothetical protein